MEKPDRATISKIAFTIIAIIFAVVHLIFPQLGVDVITLGLLVVAALPWVSAWLKALEFPGGWKVEFQDVKEAGEKIIGSTEQTTPTTNDTSVSIGGVLSPTPEQTIPRPAFLQVYDFDPNLALVALRIEIEKRLRSLAAQYQLPSKYPLIKIINDLGGFGVLDHSETEGIRALVRAGNEAAHGAAVDPNITAWAINVGPHILAAIDNKSR